MCIAAICAGGRAAADTNHCTLAEIRSAVSREGRVIQSFRAEGTVCAVAPARNLVALRDATAGAVFEVPALDPAIQAGDEILLTVDHCALTRCSFGIQLGTAPVVDNGGHHGAILKSGKVFLRAGFQPIDLTWFNGYGLSALTVEYEGPGLARQIIPAPALWRKAGPAGMEPGLDYAAYTGSWRYTVPGFPLPSPERRGVAANFDLRCSARPEEAALAFSGFIQIPAGGVYTFHLTSDDGSTLHVGNAAESCRIALLRHGTAPAPKRFEEALDAADECPWTELEGEVTFVGQQEPGLELEVAGPRGERVQVLVVESASLSATALLHRHLRAAGVLECAPDSDWRRRARLVVPGPGQIEWRDLAEGNSPRVAGGKTVLTTAREIRHLALAEARGIPARIKGVVTWTSQIALVLQDDTGGVYIHYTVEDWTRQPAVGELWEIEGRTDPGDFSPVIMAEKGSFLGSAAPPEPMRPAWDQLLNGSLDAEFVELRGALTAVSPGELSLLTPEGKLIIHASDDRPLPALPQSTPDGQALVDSIVRIRGCLMAQWDANGHVTPGHIFLSPGIVEVEEMTPPDAFALPATRAADLLRFNAGASTLQRTKVQGQIVFGRPGEYCLQDGMFGLRLLPKTPLQLEPGDWVEAVGFPQPGGPSPILREARVRVLGKRALPEPVQLSPTEPVNRSHDSTFVQIEATLLEDRSTRAWRLLELQTGQSHFTARMKSEGRAARPLDAGSRLLLSGVYRSLVEQPGSLDAFELWLNGPSGIQLLERPPWWTLRRAAMSVGVLSSVLGLALVWITVLRRQVEERTAQLERQIEERRLVEQRRLMEQERARIAKDIHDDLGASLTRITMLSLSAREELDPSAAAAVKLERVHATARELTRTMSEIVWAVNPKHDTLDSLASYFGKFAQDFLGGAGIRCRLRMPMELPAWPLTAEVRHNLFLAFKESLNNILKHARAAEAHISLETGASDFVLTVIDDGIGFSPPLLEETDESGSRNGLGNMRHRLEEMGGQCEIRSAPGAGTSVTFRVPVRRPGTGECHKNLRLPGVI